MIGFLAFLAIGSSIVIFVMYKIGGLEWPPWDEKYPPTFKSVGKAASELPFVNLPGEIYKEMKK